ncbi:MAG TPA: hypothetical protein VFW44_16835 [Bryobacteraceae bacterium]|nr:hypothetical protein [Bryobacteraceae bacterium]
MKTDTKIWAGAAIALGAAAILWAAHDDAIDYPYVPYDHAAIGYPTQPTNDAVSRLQDKLDSGAVKLDFDAKFGYLPSLLKHLGINTDSQMLVFSKTSFQAPKISPKEPRALYFNDQVAVGFVPQGDLMEFAATDPKQGVVFYTLDREKTDKPSFVRRTDQCISCHLIPGTLNVPGLLATSVIPAPDGSPRFAAAAVLVDSRTPLEQRWGGWYVTGTAGELQDRGNAVAPNPDQPDALDLRGTRNLTSLPSKVDTGSYLTNTSDLIALMTLEHQTRMTDLITRLGWETRIAMADGKVKESHDRLDFLANETVAYMLFADEAHMDYPMTGVSTFAKTFPERGPRDKKGRSLRDFDLQKRLFKYPLSFMIYDASFEGLPGAAKDQVYQKLFDVVSGKNTDKRFARLTAQDKQAILEILRETKPDLPDYWKASAGGG